ncbi:cysteine desulfurase family protein [Nitrosomonas ureae]|uniref:cysteine desulfurase n=1 Tax=Nitrosomonas ureae TaxID=44577 RepID=A0A0S3AI76_9PROT|nr:cysteine desulfurase family protein [Nitrosomonas ureae]ALQ50830.1 cysteine desulfurase [Nitrosomonas ureae]SDT85755.1 cysteine desulfurase [Nitrosomonas ureae]SEP94911.1 cysteine desulfurase [Nitrosomonas ureae]
MEPVYFDHNATTRIDDAVWEAMLPYFQREFGNASSRHGYGLNARRAIDKARRQVADAAGVQPVQVIFTSGGSEANNLFIRGAADSLKPGNLFISAIEHPCVLKPAQALSRRSCDAWAMHQLTVNASGRVDLDAASNAMQKNKPGLVATMLANNETGVIQDVAHIAESARSHGAYVHTDAIQGLGKIPLDFSALKVHAMTLSAHKIYGPKGAAALIVDKRLLLKPLIYGGGHENGLRSGTENVPAIVGFGVACELAQARMTETAQHVSILRDQLEKGLASMDAVIFGSAAARIPNTCYFALPDIEGDTLVVKLDKAGFAVAAGAACSSVNPGQSHVLNAMQVDPMLARCAVRVSLGRSNTLEQVDSFLRATQHIVAELKQISSLSF